MSDNSKKRRVSKVDVKKKQEEELPPEDEEEEEEEDDGEDEDADQEDNDGGEDDTNDNQVGEDEEEVAAKQRLSIKVKKEKKEKKSAIAAVNDKPQRISAATLKTKMSPSMLQNPIARKRIWANMMKMMTLSNYTWVQDREPPTEYEMLLPNKGILGFFHMHAEDNEKKKEPVYVIFCSRAGAPNLEKLTYPSRHILLISDGITGRARAAMQNLPNKKPPLIDLKSTTIKQPFGAVTTIPTKENVITLKDVFMEPFFSTYFMFNLLNQRYLAVLEFKTLSPPELETSI